MDLLSAIDHRISRRSYLAQPIDPATKHTLGQYLLGLNAQSSLTFEFIEDGSSAFNGFKSYGMFSGVRSLLLLKGPISDQNLYEKVGYYGEKAVLFATDLGLGTCWVAGSYDRKNDLFKVPDGEKLVIVVPIGVVKQERTAKEKFFHTLVHRKTKTIGDLLKADCTPPQWMQSAMAAVQKAPSAANRQSVSFTFQKGVLSASVPDTIPTDRIDLGIAKLHFELAGDGHFELGNGAIFRKIE